MTKKVTLLAAAVLFLTAFSASAQTGRWTALGSTGSVDPDSPAWDVIGDTGLGFDPAGGSSAGTIIAYYNVTNTWGGGSDDSPAWTRLEVGARNTSVFDTVTGRLYEVDPCTGAWTQICSVVNDTAGSSGVCEQCTFASTSVDFGQNLYLVKVEITRTAGTGNPILTTLRIW